jgi:cell division transport system permease protein
LKIKHLIAEAFRGLRTAKISTITTIFTITLSLVLIIIFLTLSVNSGKLIKSVKEKVEIEVFLSDDISNDELNDIREKIKTIGGVKNITYISKNDAAKIFEAEFGKEMLEVFESNPLPASLRINLYDEYKSIERMNKIKNLIATYPKVDDIKFPEKYLEIIERNSSVILTVNLISLIIISLSSVFLVSNTIRLVISSRKKLIDLLKLLGAKNSFIVTPFIIEGFILGLIGAVFAGLIIFVLNYYISSGLLENELRISIVNIENMIYIAAIGIFLGIFGSIITVRRFLKKETTVI